MAAVSKSTSAASAQDLLKPDPETRPHSAPPSDEEEDDLEALRLAALSTLKPKPKKPTYVVQAHAKNQNLLAIIPVDATRGRAHAHPRPRPLMPPEFDASVPPPGWLTPASRSSTRLSAESGPGPALTTTSRGYRRSPPVRGSYERGPPRGSRPESNWGSGYRQRHRPSPPLAAEEAESEYSEYSEYVTDSEVEPETPAPAESTGQGADVSAERKTRTPMSKESTKNDEDDVLQVDCSDEFTTFLNEFEEELKEEEPISSVKVKKKKRVLKRRKRVRPEPLADRRSHSPNGPSRRARTPPRRYSRSPYRSSRSPYRTRPLSPMGRRRSPSPRYRRSSPGYRPPPRHSRSPRRYSPPSRRRRRTPSPHSRDRISRYSPNPGLRFDHRAGSAPKHDDRHIHDRLSPHSLKETDVKARSLPPSREETKSARKSADRLGVNGSNGSNLENRSNDERSRAKEERDFQAKLKELPSSERERLLARHAKFAQPLSSSLTAEKKVISLKSVKVGRILTDKDEDKHTPPTKLHKRLNSEEGGDSISLSVDDTLDMFQEDNSKTAKVTDMRQKLRSKKGAPQSDSHTDLRVQLHQKRRRHVISGKDHPQADLQLEELSNDELDETLEHAQLNTLEGALEPGPIDEDVSQSVSARQVHSRGSLPKPHKRIILGGSESNPLESRVVKRSSTTTSIGPSPKKKSVMDRLGEPVHNSSVSISAVSPSSSSPPPSSALSHHHRHLITRRKVISPGETDEEEEKSSRDPSSWSSSKIVSKSPSKKDKKKEKREKKEKKKAKKAKKDKKKKKKSTATQSSDEDDEDEEGNDRDVQPELDPEEEELFSFFENQASDA